MEVYGNTKIIFEKPNLDMLWIFGSSDKDYLRYGILVTRDLST